MEDSLREVMGGAILNNEATALGNPPNISDEFWCVSDLVDD